MELLIPHISCSYQFIFGILNLFKFINPEKIKLTTLTDNELKIKLIQIQKK